MFENSENPVFEKMATFLAEFYTCLLEKGFDENQAFELTKVWMNFSMNENK